MNSTFPPGLVFDITDELPVDPVGTLRPLIPDSTQPGFVTAPGGVYASGGGHTAAIAFDFSQPYEVLSHGPESYDRSAAAFSGENSRIASKVSSPPRPYSPQELDIMHVLRPGPAPHSPYPSPVNPFDLLDSQPNTTSGGKARLPLISAPYGLQGGQTISPPANPPPVARYLTDQPDGLFIQVPEPPAAPAAKPKQNDWLDGLNTFMGGVADSAVSMAQGLFSEAAAFTRARPIYNPTDGRELKGLRQREMQASLNQERNAERGLTDPGLDKELLEVRQRIATIDLQAKLRGEQAYQGSTLHFISEGYQDIADSLGKERAENKAFYNVDPDFQNSFTGKVIGAAGQMVPQSLASALPGVGLAALQSQAFQLSLDDARETAERTGQPYDPEKAYSYAFTNSFMQALLEKAGLDSALGKWLKTGGEATLRAFLKRTVVGAAGNGGTESIQGAMQDLLATTTGIEDRNPLDLAKRAEEFAIGGILSTGISSFQTVSDILAARATPEPGNSPPQRFDPEQPTRDFVPYIIPAPGSQRATSAGDAAIAEKRATAAEAENRSPARDSLVSGKEAENSTASTPPPATSTAAREKANTAPDTRTLGADQSPESSTGPSSHSAPEHHPGRRIPVESAEVQSLRRSDHRPPSSETSPAPRHPQGSVAPAPEATNTTAEAPALPARKPSAALAILNQEKARLHEKLSQTPPRTAAAQILGDRLIEVYAQAARFEAQQGRQRPNNAINAPGRQAIGPGPFSDRAISSLSPSTPGLVETSPSDSRVPSAHRDSRVGSSRTRPPQSMSIHSPRYFNAQATSVRQPNRTFSVLAGSDPGLINSASPGYGPRPRRTPNEAESKRIAFLEKDLERIHYLLEGADQTRGNASELDALQKLREATILEILRLKGDPWYSPEKQAIRDARPVHHDEIPASFRPLLDSFKSLDISAVWESASRASIRYDTDGNLQFLLPTDAFEFTLEAQKAGVQAFTDPFAVFGEEITHGAIFSHMRDAWIKEGRPGSFLDYVDNAMAGVFSDLRTTIETAPPHQRKALTEAVRDSYYTYFSDEAPSDITQLDLEAILADIQAGPNLVAFVLEFTRQASQLKRQGHITESVRQRLLSAAVKIAEWIRPALLRLQASLPRAYRGDFGK